LKTALSVALQTLVETMGLRTARRHASAVVRPFSIPALRPSAAPAILSQDDEAYGLPALL
jgi:hypothetical protein